MMPDRGGKDHIPWEKKRHPTWGYGLMDSRWQRLWDFTQKVQKAAGMDGECGLFAWEIHAQPHATAEHNFDMWSSLSPQRSVPRPQGTSETADSTEP